MKSGKVALMITGILVVTLGAGALYAFNQNRRASMIEEFIQFKVDKELQRLDLTPQQQEKVAVLREKIRDDVRGSIMKNAMTRQDLVSEFSTSEPDRQKIRDLIDQRLNRQRDLAYSISDYLLEFHEVLTPDQRGKLMDRLEEMRQERFGNFMAQ